MDRLYGRCACGDVRYSADIGSSQRCFCSCALCRLASGEPVVVGVQVPAAALHWCAGTAVFYGRPSSTRQGLCAKCGTSLCTLQPDGSVSLDVSTMEECSAIGVRSHVRATYDRTDAPLRATAL
ncbi:MAG TPA: GFA family protein [Dyella sp.]|nr:GFA family protein [Dyella sp.]